MCSFLGDLTGSFLADLTGEFVGWAALVVIMAGLGSDG
jgi:hypothetical protein